MSQVPAWKRLGLKLKHPPADGTEDAGRDQDAKRRLSQLSSSPIAAQPSLPKLPARLSDSGPAGRSKTQSTTSQPVSLSSEAPARSTAQAATRSQGSKAKRGRTSKLPDKTDPKLKIKPCLQYLEQWETTKDAWKFNKNYQTLLLGFAFDPDLLPPSHIDIFYRYIHGLQGTVRQRLRDSAEQIKRDDMADQDVEYHDLISSFTDTRSRSGKPEFSFDEGESMGAPMKPGHSKRLVKRMRAEAISQVLSDDVGAEMSSAPTSVLQTAETARDDDIGTSDSGDGTGHRPKSDSPAGKRRKLDEGGKQRARPRRRNLRVGEKKVAPLSATSSGSDGTTDEESGSPYMLDL